jgi:tetratricopeptide (TPR) repeat protein
LDEIEGAKIPEIPVYVLTSNYTFSGAEEFAYNLKTRERATIIGETTGGGANPGGMNPITEKLGMFIPTGRAINPITGTNWEGTGVEPHILVAADSALEVALTEAPPAAEQYKKSKIDKAKILISEIHSTEIEVEKLVRAGKIPEASDEFFRMLKIGIDQKLLNEMDINRMGYEYLRKDNLETAIIVFKFNVEAFSDAFNTYDSLGEAYMKNGDTQQAIQSYKKSLELNPNNNNAVNMLEQLENEE